MRRPIAPRRRGPTLALHRIRRAPRRTGQPRYKSRTQGIKKVAVCLNLYHELKSPRVWLGQEPHHRTRVDWAFRQPGIAGEFKKIIKKGTVELHKALRPRQADQRDPGVR